MQLATFEAVCPYEIGDRVQMPGGNALGYKITDIACTHFLRTGDVVFTYELDHRGNYVRLSSPEEEKGEQERRGKRK